MRNGIVNSMSAFCFDFQCNSTITDDFKNLNKMIDSEVVSKAFVNMSLMVDDFSRRH